ncbi:MAG: hypothetical protein JJ971_05085 [Balneolaceae bacterium]|nr:hypothetical protein [Balneolaceae bacterium]MBO6545751.1 hypothetical protein [Balneolaceae bacterium]MBO6647147.1 hypothetical protein [Balneolaceae bacterium]
MPAHNAINNKIVFKGNAKEAEDKHRPILSLEIRKKFGKGPFSKQETVRDIILFCLNYYVTEFKDVCHKETSLTFYQNILWFHEQATEIAVLHKEDDLSEPIDHEYISIYRRVLKFILETGCDVKMVSGEATDQKFISRIEPVLNNLLYLGEMILSLADFYAEQSMIEEVVLISFDEKGQFKFSRNHHYNFIFEHIIKELGTHLFKTVVDESDLAGIEDLKNSFQECFGIKYEAVSHMVAAIDKQLKEKGDSNGVNWETYTYNMKEQFSIPYEITEQLFGGLRLDKNIKMDLLDLACKPYRIDRYLYKPLLIWNIDGKDFSFLGVNAWTESLLQYATNAIPWGKAPKEWLSNQCFKKYVHKKEDEHGKWLENAFEKIVLELNLKYDRNVKTLNHNKGSERIDIKGLGEVDFIVVSNHTKRIYIIDCKHLMSRYDIANQRNDYNAFVLNKKSYNKTMRNKLDWFTSNKAILIQHLSGLGGVKEIENYSIEGVFVINTPTLYMYNSEFRIYTISQIKDVLLNKYVDPKFLILDEENNSTYSVGYPYFKKPKQINFDRLSEQNDH